MRRAPGNHVRGRFAADHRKWRLQRIHVADALAAIEQLDVEIRYAGRAHFAFLDQPHHFVPRVFNRHAGRVRPVKLIKVDPLDAEALQRAFDLAPNRIGANRARHRSERFSRVRNNAALRKNHRPLRRRNFAQRAPDHFLGMPDAVHRRSVNPVHAVIDGAPDGGDGLGVILLSPRKNPASAARRPSAEADGGNFDAAGTQRPFIQFRSVRHSCPLCRAARPTRAAF